MLNLRLLLAFPKNLLNRIKRFRECHNVIVSWILQQFFNASACSADSIFSFSCHNNMKARVTCAPPRGSIEPAHTYYIFYFSAIALWRKRSMRTRSSTIERVLESALKRWNWTDTRTIRLLRFWMFSSRYSLKNWQFRTILCPIYGSEWYYAENWTSIYNLQ